MQSPAPTDEEVLLGTTHIMYTGPESKLGVRNASVDLVHRKAKKPHVVPFERRNLQ